MKIEEIFVSEAAKFGVNLSPVQLQQFKIYYEHLIEVNQSYNLTAITDLEGVYFKHFLDSISMLEWENIKDKSLLDIGTGAGFPGVPLKIIEPDCHITLIDSNQKKIKFLNELIEKLDLKNIKAVHKRVEELDSATQFDLVVSRAVARMSILFELAYPKIKMSGSLIAFKGKNYYEELNGSDRFLKELDVLVEVKSASLSQRDHHLVLMKKNTNQPIKIRHYSQISKTPLW
jgi:16S rRNA (guanine527-N7)-methyltransferase